MSQQEEVGTQSSASMCRQEVGEIFVHVDPNHLSGWATISLAILTLEHLSEYLMDYGQQEVGRS